METRYNSQLLADALTGTVHEKISPARPAQVLVYSLANVNGLLANFSPFLVPMFTFIFIFRFVLNVTFA